MEGRERAKLSSMGMGQIQTGMYVIWSQAEEVIKDSTEGEGLNGWSTAQRWTRTPWVVNQFSGD